MFVAGEAAEALGESVGDAKLHMGLHDGSGDPKQRFEAFLLEMAIISEDFLDFVSANRLHGDAVGEAVFLVGALDVQIKATEKRFASLAQDGDRRVCHQVPDRGCGAVSLPRRSRWRRN